MAPRPAHYLNGHDRRSRAARAAWTANPATTCYRCGRTLAAHPPVASDGRPQRWEADHATPGDPHSPLVPSATSCNRRHGAQHGNALRAEPHSESW